MKRRIKTLAIAGSARKDSYNLRLLTELKNQAPAALDFTFFDQFAHLPMFNEDFAAPENRPEIVNRLNKRIADADLVVIATPEYCRSIPGILKNLLDWASIERSFHDKPVGILGGTTGVWGTRDAQAHLHQILAAMGAMPMQRPNVFVNEIHNQLAQIKAGETTKLSQRLSHFAQALCAWSERCSHKMDV